MGKVNVGIIGLGIGAWHAEEYLACPEANLIAICDTDKPWLEHCQKKWNVPYAFTDAAEMLALPELQAVSVATATWLHKPLTLAALKAGKHVLCEKPMAMNAAEGEEMVAAAKRAGRLLMINYNRRFDETSRTIKAIIDEGTLGQIYFARAVWQRRCFIPEPIARGRATGPYDRSWAVTKGKSGGGALLDIGVHVLDLTWWLSGRPAFKDCLASTYSKLGPGIAARQGGEWHVEDLAVGFLRFANGMSMELEASFASHVDAERVYLELYGTKAGISTRDGSLRLYQDLVGVQTDSVVIQRVRTENTRAHFARCILSGTQPDPSGEDGVAGLRMLDALYASAGDPIR
jgi:predicted dehydrogenase